MGSARQRIIGGEAGGPAWAVALVRRGSGELHCSAAQVGPKTLVTAAHCVDEMEPLVAVMGGRSLELRALHRHPRAHDAAFDVAVVELAEPRWPSERVLRLPAQAIAEAGQPLVIAGFGVSATGVGELRTLDAVVATVTPTTLTIASDAGVPCRGDSGGVAALVELDGGASALAVVSQGDPQCLQATTFARLDTVGSWVRRTMASWEGGSCAEDGRCVAGCEVPDPDCGCESDGVCDERCVEARLDSDCASDCAADDVCSAGPCPHPDVDCVPLGAACGSSLVCGSRRCASVEAGRPPVCTSACSTAVDCESGFECGERGWCRPTMAVAPEAGGCSASPGLGTLLAVVLFVRCRRRAGLSSGRSRP